MTYYRGRRAFGFDPILILIVTNAALFLVTTLAPDLIYTLGLQPAAFLKRPWTLLSSMFLHSGLFHLLANM
ncbi:MAG: rhomboid family intramembrane serine protease, partial [Dehalococcoidales bacterium]